MLLQPTVLPSCCFKSTLQFDGRSCTAGLQWRPPYVHSSGVSPRRAPVAYIDSASPPFRCVTNNRRRSIAGTAWQGCECDNARLRLVCDCISRVTSVYEAEPTGHYADDCSSPGLLTKTKCIKFNLSVSTRLMRIKADNGTLLTSAFMS